ncbi:MAG: TlpA disulfide reductase family protein [Ginsengibacter sp.]
MKKALMIYFILLATSCYSQSPSSEEFSMSADSFLVAMDKKNKEFIGKPFPQFAAVANNKECSNQMLQGKIVFINFWFAACAPCIAEMDALNELFSNFRQDKNFAFVSFTFENSKEIDLLKKKYDIHYDVYSISQAECYRLNNNSGFPTSIILDAQGYVLFIHSADQLGKLEIKKYFTTKMYPLILKELQHL